MSKIFTIEPNEFIKNLSNELKSVKEIKAPDWSKFCKTGVHKERCPVELDWWHVRSAAILRSIFRLGPIGTEKLRTKYGGRQRRGVKTEHHKKGSGSIIRKILQQLEEAKLIKQTTVKNHKGRVVTKEGKDMLNMVAGIKPTIIKEIKEEPIEIKEEPIEKKEEVKEKTKEVKEVKE